MKDCIKILIELISIIVAMPTAIIAIVQWKNTNKLNKAKYIDNINNTLRNDEDFQKIIYLLEYDELWYDENFHNNHSLERQIDKVLSYFSYICYLRKFHLLSKKDFHCFEYEITRIVKNDEMEAYLFNIYHFSNKCNHLQFYYLFKYIKKNKIYDNDFYNKDSVRYIAYLDF